MSNQGKNDKGNKGPEKDKGHKGADKGKPEDTSKVTPPESKPEPATPVVDMPDPITTVLPISCIPDPREHPEMNLRAVNQGKDQSLAQAVITSWDVEPLMKDIEAGAPNQVPPIFLAVWKEKPDILDLETGDKVPAFKTKLPDGREVFAAIADGNTRMCALKMLQEKYPGGHEVTLHTGGPNGTTIEKKVNKTYDSVAVTIYEGLSPTQYHRLQLINGNRRQYKKGEVARKAIEFILQRPTMAGLEKATIAHVQSRNMAIYTKAKDPHGAFQEFWRAALGPKDYRQGFIDYRNDVKGVSHPNPDDLRNISPHIQMEIVSYAGGEVKPGVFWDNRIVFKQHTFADIESFWKGWTPDQCSSAADRAEKRAANLTQEADRLDATSLQLTRDDKTSAALKAKQEAEDARGMAAWLRMTSTKLRTGATPDKLSEALSKYKSMADNQGPRGGAKEGRAMDAKALANAKGEVFNAGAPVAALTFDTIRGAKGAPEAKVGLDVLIRFEKLAWELIDKYEPAKGIALREELTKLTPLGD